MYHLLTFVIGLLVGLYLAASFSESVMTGFQKVHVPLLGTHMSASVR
jgi:hypothetical protein